MSYASIVTTVCRYVIPNHWSDKTSSYDSVPMLNRHVCSVHSYSGNIPHERFKSVAIVSLCLVFQRVRTGYIDLEEVYIRVPSQGISQWRET